MSLTDSHSKSIDREHLFRVFPIFFNTLGTDIVVILKLIWRWGMLCNYLLLHIFHHFRLNYVFSTRCLSDELYMLWEHMSNNVYIKKLFLNLVLKSFKIFFERKISYSNSKSFIQCFFFFTILIELIISLITSLYFR